MLHVGLVEIGFTLPHVERQREATCAMLPVLPRWNRARYFIFSSSFGMESLRIIITYK